MSIFSLEAVLIANARFSLEDKRKALHSRSHEEGIATAHLAESEVSAHKAKNIALEDSANKFTATEVEGAMLELFTNVSNGKQLVGTAITDVDPNVGVPSEPSFLQLANSIRSISTGKKWASGILTNGSNTITPITDGTVTNVPKPYVAYNGLEFTPNVIIVWKNNVQKVATMYVAPANFSHVQLPCNILLMQANLQPLPIRPISPVSVTNNGFILPVNDANSTYSWVAYE